jgi:hypothetical protein
MKTKRSYHGKKGLEVNEEEHGISPKILLNEKMCLA